MNPLKIINKYHNPDSKDYAILVIHSVLVTQKALDVARKYKEKNKKARLSLKFIYEAGMLHDIGFGLIPKTAHYITHGFYGADILRKEKLIRHAKVAENHIGVGLTQEEVRQSRWQMPAKDYLPQTLEEKIISFADLFYSKKPNRLFREESLEQIIKEIKGFKNPQEKLKIFQNWYREFNL